MESSFQLQRCADSIPLTQTLRADDGTDRRRTQLTWRIVASSGELDGMIQRKSGEGQPHSTAVRVAETVGKYAWLALVAASLCHALTAVSAEKVIYWTTNSADEVACQRHLNVIYGALQEYLKRNHDLPHWLSELVPEYIHDPETLVCPYVQSTGNLKKWRERFLFGDVFKDPGKCSYGYEFCACPGSLPGWTTRTYKERQMELLGLSVPIVRCHAHRPYLNLGFDGTLFSNRHDWEDVFDLSPEHKSVLHRPQLMTNISHNKLVSRLSEPRMPATDKRLLDLSDHYNALLLHLSQVDPAGKLVMTYPEGVQKIGPIDFDVRGLVHLTGKNFPVAFPQRVNIPVSRACAAIHFLHGTATETADGKKVASFVMRFRDRRSAEMRIIYGRDVRMRWFDQSQKSELENPEPAWITPPDRVPITGKSLRLYVSSWTNQQPALEIASIDFISQMSESAPFLLAITVE